MDKPTSPESSRNLDPFQEIERQLQIKIKKVTVAGLYGNQEKFFELWYDSSQFQSESNITYHKPKNEIR